MSKPSIVIVGILAVVVVASAALLASGKIGLPARSTSSVTVVAPAEQTSNSAPAPIQTPTSVKTPPAGCLPAGRTMADVVSVGMGGKNKVTVADELARLHAYCSGNRVLYDGNGKEIYFYNLTGCWGNPPADYQEQLQRQDEEIRQLERRYTVIRMTCNPSGMPIS